MAIRASFVLWATAFFTVLASAAAVAIAGAAADSNMASGLQESRHAAAMAAAAPNSRRHILDLDRDNSLGNASHADLLAAALAPRAVASNLQTFQGALAGIVAPPITQSNDATRQFTVEGDTFNDFASAVGRSCDNQHNACADAANSQKQAGVSVSDCDTQNTQCKDTASTATQTAFVELASSTAEFDFFCDL